MTATHGFSSGILLCLPSGVLVGTSLKSKLLRRCHLLVWCRRRDHGRRVKPISLGVLFGCVRIEGCTCVRVERPHKESETDAPAIVSV
jgi:hypothetical protein